MSGRCLVQATSLLSMYFSITLLDPVQDFGPKWGGGGGGLLHNGRLLGTVRYIHCSLFKHATSECSFLFRLFFHCPSFSSRSRLRNVSLLSSTMLSVTTVISYDAVALWISHLRSRKASHASILLIVVSWRVSLVLGSHVTKCCVIVLLIMSWVTSH